MTRRRELLDQIRQQRKELDELYDKLHRSIMIQEIWPEAFANDCKCAPVLLGTNYPIGATMPPFVKPFPPPYARVRKITRTFFRRSDGVEYDVDPEVFMSMYGEKK